MAVAGYCYQRLAERRNVEGSGQLLAGGRAAATSRAAFANLFQSIGENFPAAKNEQNPYRVRLTAAGYRWPSALPIFYGIKCGSALFFAGLFGILALLLPARSFAYTASHDLRTGTRIPAARSRSEFARTRPRPAPAQRHPAGAGPDGARHGSRPGAGSIHRRRQPRLEAHPPGLERGSSRSSAWS